jgi:hypothetical protein
MAVYVMAEGAVESHGPIPVHPKPVQSSRGKSGGGIGMSTTIIGLGDIDTIPQTTPNLTENVALLALKSCACKCMYPD